MDFIQLIKERYSARKFSDKKVEQEKLDLILDAARFAPTACNLQPQRLLILNETESLEKLKNCTPFHFNAPLAILVCYDEASSWKRKYDNSDEGAVDASIVTTHMMLEIANLGLGSTWVGSFNPEKVKENFELPENYIPVAILPIGYPSEDCEPSPAHEARFEKEKTIFYNSFK